jgi:phosphatidylglycerophosphatase A
MVQTKRIHISALLGSAFGLGRIPFMPGTVASFACVVLAFLLSRSMRIPLIADLGILLLFCLLGFLSIATLSRRGLSGDPSWFVMDEIAGMWLALLGLPKQNIPVLIMAFVLFRLFDILKPWLIKRIDQMEQPSAVMLDDLLAAVPAWLGAFILWKL